MRERIARLLEGAGAALAFVGLALAVSAGRLRPRGPLRPAPALSPLVCDRCRDKAWHGVGMRCARGDAAADLHADRCCDTRCQWPADACIGGTCAPLPCPGIYRVRNPRRLGCNYPHVATGECGTERVPLCDGCADDVLAEEGGAAW